MGHLGSFDTLCTPGLDRPDWTPPSLASYYRIVPRNAPSCALTVLICLCVQRNKNKTVTTQNGPCSFLTLVSCSTRTRLPLRFLVYLHHVSTSAAALGFGSKGQVIICLGEVKKGHLPLFRVLDIHNLSTCFALASFFHRPHAVNSPKLSSDPVDIMQLCHQTLYFGHLIYPSR